MASTPTTKIRLYDTLTRQKRDFVPLDAGNVRMYVCGPTVYDYAHIGNARPAIVFDVLFRLMRHVYGEDHVTYVRNITDVDDKIIDRARRDHPDLELNAAIREVTERTANQYQKDVTALGCLPPTHQPRATEFVSHRDDGKPDMVGMIEKLIAKGHAYVAGGEVLFDTKSMADYGALSHRNLDEQQAGARIEVADHKHNPGDFVLWKLSDATEPGWDSPWGRGRPGWHIECSVMSAAYLGTEFDIHGGGLDLIFPHHENELAQSRCAHGSEIMAKTWMHNGFLQVEGRKMSKSEGNFITIHELLETEKFGGRKWPGEVLRLAMLMTHYREPIDFSVRRLEEAENLLENYLTWPILDGENTFRTGEVAPPAEFVEALCDDLDTPKSRTVLDRLAKIAGDANVSMDLSDIDSTAEEAAFWQLDACLMLIGIDLLEMRSRSLRHRDEVKDSVNAAVARRLELLEAKQFADADAIRDALASQGVQLMDYKDPDTGERRTKWEVRK